MTDKDNSLNAIKYRIEHLLGLNPMYWERKLEIRDEVYSCLYDALLIFMKSVIRNMAQYKKKYDIVCPLLKPLEKVKPGNEQVVYKVEALYNETPYTVEDVFSCFKYSPNTIPRRNIYQVYLLHLTQLINGRNPRKKKIKKEKNEEH